MGPYHFAREPQRSSLANCIGVDIDSASTGIEQHECITGLQPPIRLAYCKQTDQIVALYHSQ